MADIPAAAPAAGAEAVNEAHAKRGWNKPAPWWATEVATAVLDAAAPLLAEETAELREKARRQAAQIDHMRQVLERKNRQLDALHMVWCDGGCPSGVHRYQDRDVLVTEEWWPPPSATPNGCGTGTRP